ncbi:MAG TPA: ferritin-like domain-containing protein [Mycobacteriales bacterium]|nr:ferritin-like domain-containing protein [Mycobacteriales bacterium]
MTELEALQAALAAEYQAVYGYGVVGAALTGHDREFATAALTAHQEQRDRLVAMITALGATPVAAAPAYRLPFPVTGRASAGELGGHLERGIAGAAWDLVAAAQPDSTQRSAAIAWLGAAAVRGAHWGMTQALPGQPA